MFHVDGLSEFVEVRVWGRGISGSSAWISGRGFVGADTNHPQGIFRECIVSIDGL
ncbi:hypothetical protein CCYS_11775 [Corynebacterium cystitidis DSM 20524]|uniref:Uncharacterized protein n=1 Tax=Corynebacterium cystitidis DSM 20524 TaxID=1121357 RepID=A0A1H9W882_9CORY|nr:hypothetical protein [Corynebacterium cystitidis]WJY83245.1 hypothetical protein CCYS_11775 [Corynebacterium cystitidis DSM 20524]SES29663.1 hypothetical protein SAMN05661109_02575 [Corynebacterium cystitidis DSM 20524]SNV67976.1 Uncharacterised protein [Corynebacterium cystitidis]